jgi:hypothetical protein
MPKDLSYSAPNHAPSVAHKGTPVQRPVQKEKITAKEKHFDVLRPLRYGFAMVGGSIKGSLDGMAYLGRKGWWFGLGVGLLVGVANVALLPAVAGPFLGLAAGAVIGGAIGLATGASRGVGRAQRKEKYADDLAQREKKRVAAQSEAPVIDYNDVYEARRRVIAYNFERSQQQQRENRGDYGTYWQDGVGSSNGSGRGF